MQEPGTASPLSLRVSAAESAAFKVLVFSRTKGYRHDSIPAGIAALKDLATKSQSLLVPFTVDDTEDSIVLNPSTLAQYRVIVFLQSSGEFLDNEIQLSALKSFVRSGGGVVGIHGASTGMRSSEWYGRLIGAVFTEHSKPQRAEIVIEDPAHPILSNGTALQSPKITRPTSGRDGTLHWDWFDEWYSFAANPPTVNEGVHVLMTVRANSYSGGKLGADHPIAWCQEFQGSRSFYTALGHFDQAYEDVAFVSQILNAILWTAQV